MSLPKVGTLVLRKGVHTRKYDLFFIYLGSRNGTCFLLNRHGNIINMSVAFFESAIRMNECKIVDG